jgi:hypothetical protein
VIPLDRRVIPAFEGSSRYQIEDIIGLNSSPLSSYAKRKKFARPSSEISLQLLHREGLKAEPSGEPLSFLLPLPLTNGHIACPLLKKD